MSGDPLVAEGVRGRLRDLDVVSDPVLDDADVDEGRPRIQYGGGASIRPPLTITCSGVQRAARVARVQHVGNVYGAILAPVRRSRVSQGLGRVGEFVCVYGAVYT